MSIARHREQLTCRLEEAEDCFLWLFFGARFKGMMTAWCGFLPSHCAREDVDGFIGFVRGNCETPLARERVVAANRRVTDLETNRNLLLRVSMCGSLNAL